MLSGSGGTGRRSSLRSYRLYGLGGSNPSSRTRFSGCKLARQDFVHGITCKRFSFLISRFTLKYADSNNPLTAIQSMSGHKAQGASMERSVASLLSLYRPENPLEKAFTIPSPWYFDDRLARLEAERVFARAWQVAGRVDQVCEKGQFFTVQLGDEPIVVARGEDGVLRAFYNVCRHHAAAVVTEAQGCAKQFRCPYHRWTYR